jgi:hypothetical protein
MTFKSIYLSITGAGLYLCSPEVILLFLPLDSAPPLLVKLSKSSTNAFIKSLFPSPLAWLGIKDIVLTP